MKITFYRSATNEKSELYKSPIFSVTVPDATSREAALAIAIRRLQEHMSVADWQQIAEFYELS